jgi:hypothetical protein
MLRNAFARLVPGFRRRIVQDRLGVPDPHPDFLGPSMHWNATVVLLPVRCVDGAWRWPFVEKRMIFTKCDPAGGPYDYRPIWRALPPPEPESVVRARENARAWRQARQAARARRRARACRC